jgi:hypothetical protein
MTFRRPSLVAVALFAVGCAALPNAGDDILCQSAPDACKIITSDGSADASFVDGQFAIDAGAPTAMPRTALCSGSCDPDSVTACADAGADSGAEACRVVLGAGQQTEATCSKSGVGTDGASCTSGADCAPGFECTGTGTCRAYCCSSEVCDKMTKDTNGYETYFCDVATEHASSGAIVPVCNLAVHCAPFSDTCNAGEACTIVEVNNGNGLVATCDAVGTQLVGDSCEQAHCAAGLACLGTLGMRTCEQLCDPQHPCPANSGTSCVTGVQALMNYKVGVCL